MQRYKLTIAYNGICFHGWQWQKGPISVQKALEEAIKQFSGEQIRTSAAGRTDSGVHATAQVVHFDLKKVTSPQQLLRALNYYLPAHQVSVMHAEKVRDTFHARFSAISRTYVYHIFNHPSLNPLRYHFVAHEPRKLDINAMEKGLQYLVGQHDFSSFRAKHCQSLSAVKTMSAISIHTQEDEICITFTAQSFLYHQIRIIIGTVLTVGYGKQPPEWIHTVLQAKDRSKAGITAPSYGLYFTHVEYPKE